MFFFLEHEYKAVIWSFTKLQEYTDLRSWRLIIIFIYNISLSVIQKEAESLPPPKIYEFNINSIVLKIEKNHFRQFEIENAQIFIAWFAFYVAYN